MNPNEVEEEIKKVNGVLDAYVYAKSNRLTGNIIVADVVIDKEQYSEKEIEKEIYEKLKNNLQSWKIPRILNFVDNLSLTRTGKKVRK
ncbi:MAG: AMP-binding enzyme [Fervidobacterium sp.]